MDTRTSGSIAESEVTTELIKCGAIVSEPLYYEARYDLIADFNGDIYRVQVKRAFDSGNENSVKVEARCRNNDGNCGYSDNEIDSIAVYIPDTDSVHWYWISEVSDQFNIYTGNWDDLNAGHKSCIRNPVEYRLCNRKI